MGLTQELEWFVDDLVGDGWQVVQRTALRHNKTELSSNMTHASELRDWLALEAEKAGHVTRALILVGHVPVVMTGQSDDPITGAGGFVGWGARPAWWLQRMAMWGHDW